MFTKRQIIKQSIIIIGIILFCSTGFSYDTSKTIPQDIQVMIQRGEYKDAFLKMLKLRQKDPTVDLIYEMAKTLEKMQSFNLALFYYQDLAINATSKELIDIAKNKIRQYYKLYTLDDLTQEKSDVSNHLTLGLEKLNKGDYHKATLHFLLGRNKQQQNFLLHFWLAYSYYKVYQKINKKQEYLDAAIKSYQNSLQIVQSPKSLNNLACIFGEQDDKVLAFMYFTKAIEATQSPNTLPGLQKAIQSNLDFFTKRDPLGQYKYLKESNSY
ncbi:MAG: hypothetical protein COB02_15200 [Candidatus Cloacimonadota bacterium]|nr:MAG: hypothetical protein COB02_15200 [Candidatus Cloacimonadota bacterium]